MYLLLMEGRRGEKIKRVRSPPLQAHFRWCDDKLRGWKAYKLRPWHTVIKYFGSPMYSSLCRNANRPGPAVSLTSQLGHWGLRRAVLQHPFLCSRPSCLPKSNGCHFGAILITCSAKNNSFDFSWRFLHNFLMQCSESFIYLWKSVLLSYNM